MLDVYADVVRLPDLLFERLPDKLKKIAAGSKVMWINGSVD